MRLRLVLSGPVGNHHFPALFALVSALSMSQWYIAVAVGLLCWTALEGLVLGPSYPTKTSPSRSCFPTNADIDPRHTTQNSRIAMSKANDKKAKGSKSKSKTTASAYKQAQSKPTTTAMPFAKKFGEKQK